MQNDSQQDCFYDDAEPANNIVVDIKLHNS